MLNATCRPLSSFLRPAMSLRPNGVLRSYHSPQRAYHSPQRGSEEDATKDPDETANTGSAFDPNQADASKGTDQETGKRSKGASAADNSASNPPKESQQGNSGSKGNASDGAKDGQKPRRSGGTAS